MLESRQALWFGASAETDRRCRELFAGFLDYARRHRAVIERFPPLSASQTILGRASTAEELASLAGSGAPF